ncbi:Abi-alpha family protein [Duganella sp. HH101]|uniref:Abi-alpha family protein n=1 Tax=Duganella sp. HH101 TaxID=1781066 RepID=UPI000873CFEB|nr:Abi-alpha family protein [Duganella sp. HH101]OFA00174.1 hypothetical protein DUGA2_50070 [Duganella sp. HH101]
MDDDSIKEVAKATSELAKVGSKIVDATTGAGAAFAKFFGGPINEVSGMITDRLQYVRWERQIRLYERAMDFMNERGLRAPTRQIPLKLAIPLLEAATLEEDNSLQDVWARMLVNATDVDHAGELTRSFIVMLEQLTSLEVQILKCLYSVKLGDDTEAAWLTTDLPNSTTASHQATIDWNNTQDPSPEVCLGIANLQRLGCLRVTETLGGIPIFRLVSPTILGEHLYSLCLDVR